MFLYKFYQERSKANEVGFEISQDRELTNLELVKKAEDCMDKLKLEKAVSLLDEGIKRFPNDTLILDLYTDLLIQLGENGKAREVSFFV